VVSVDGSGATPTPAQATIAATTPLAIAQAVAMSFAAPDTSVAETASATPPLSPDTATAPADAGQAPAAIDPSLIRFVRFAPSAPAAPGAAAPTAADPSTPAPALAATDGPPPDSATDAQAPVAAANGAGPTPAPLSAATAPIQFAPVAAAAALVTTPTARAPLRPTAASQPVSAASARAASPALRPASAVVFAAPASDVLATPDADNAPANPQSANSDASQSQALVDATVQTPLAAPIQSSAAAALPVVANPPGAEIAAQLAAQISSKAEAGASRFDFALNPQGLGHVDVTLKIDATGQLSASFTFDNPATAAEAKGRAGELQQALQQAGFDVSQSGLSFTTGGGQSQGQSPGWQDGSAQTYARAAQAPGDSTPDLSLIALPTASAASGAGSVDITI
jgi:hypothetical protein